MAPKRWTTPHQFEFLTSNIPGFRNARLNDTLNVFLKQLYNEWFERFPEPNSQKEQRKAKIYNWLRNNKSNVNRSPDEHMDALRQCLRTSAQETGCFFFVAACGLRPRIDGKVDTFSISVSPTEDGQNIKNASGEFNDAIMAPFATFVRGCFPLELGYRRALASQDDNTDMEPEVDQPEVLGEASIASHSTLESGPREHLHSHHDVVSTDPEEFVLPTSSFKRPRLFDDQEPRREATTVGSNKKDVSVKTATQPDASPTSAFGDSHVQSLSRSSPALSKRSSEPADVTTKRKRTLRPFPMSTQMLQSITPSEGLSRKRLLDRMGSEKKKRKKRSDENGGMALVGIESNEEDEDDFPFLDPKIDPKDLCPYCDDPLPPNPTPYLLELLATAKSASVPDGRPTNPSGRKATMTVYVALCQRHRFENELVPKAKEMGWKEVIDWEDVKGRVEAMRGALMEILEDVNGGEEVRHEGADGRDGDEERRVGEEDRGRGARWRCVFWREFKAEVQQKGTRGVIGASGQFSSFENLQPGYYGEQGSDVIYQTLCTMFPPTSIDPRLTDPLTSTDFHQRILVPQVGLMLIREDLHLSVEKALKTMRDSAAYGVAKFPVGGGEVDGAEWEDGDFDEDKMGVADKIVLERARQRRKELDVEERVEREALEKQLDNAAAGERMGKNDKLGKRRVRKGKSRK